MEEIFVTKLRINKVRHLENLEIPLSDTERKHLILTGKNGSGKTSVLLDVKNYLLALSQNWFTKRDNPNFWDIYRNYEYQIINTKNSLNNLLSTYNNDANPYWKDDSYIIFQQRVLKNWEGELQFMKLISEQNIGEKSNLSIYLEINNESYFKEYQEKRKLIDAFFDSKRTNFVGLPVGAIKIVNVPIYNIRQRANINFNQFIVNLKSKRAFAYEKGDKMIVNEIDSWFDKFVELLKFFFDDKNLDFNFNADDFNFYINTNNKEPFDLNNLSDGYSALFSIMTEIMMRMESNVPKLYDTQGIVLIDEIETHLHIDLQKKILPFLTSFFPKIQFIVTTHSPFVLSSIDNAVIYDLEKQIRVEDLSDYKYHEIVDTYFEENQYSDFVEKQVAKYEGLISKEKLTEQEEETLYDLRKYFRKLPFFLSPELQLKIQSLELYPQNSQV